MNPDKECGPRPAMAAIGTFDGVHCGHREMLRQMTAAARRLGYAPMVVTFDRHPLEVVAPDRAPRMLMPLDRRVEALRELVERVEILSFNEDMRSLTAAEFMKMLRDRYGVKSVFMGFNHRFGSDRLNDIEQYRREAGLLGMAVFVGDEERGLNDAPVSSTEIRRMIDRGDVRSASEILGRHYRISGPIVKGKQLGRTIGFPTANLVPAEERQLVPARGVYACRAITADGNKYNGVVNIGVRPTVSDSGERSIEVHLLDFADDLYGRELTIEFIDRLRDERRFASLEALRRQLEADVESARTLLK